MWGADRSTATVAIIVNMVKIMRQNLSTTIAANFQSLMSSASSSAFLILPVMNWSSLSMACISLWATEHDALPESSKITAAPRPPLLRNPEEAEVLLVPVQCRKSSSMSNTLARRLFEDRSLSSISFMRLVMRIVFRVIFLPGRLIPSIHGNHCKNTLLICKGNYKSVLRPKRC